MVVAEVVPGESFAIGEQRALFSMAGFDSWDVSPDDGRFVMTRGGGAARAGSLIVVENVFEELRREVGN